MKFLLENPEATEAFGAKLAQLLPAHTTVFLQGQLGAGKTTLVRGFLRALGHNGTVKSPTYTLVEEYDLAQGKIFHFDLYRVKGPEELDWIGNSGLFYRRCYLLCRMARNGCGFFASGRNHIAIIVRKTRTCFRNIKNA